jgi:glycosyltransferase involved in cell wall biosynthesis
MYNGVDTKCFQTAKKDESRKKLGLPDNRKIVLSVRRLVYKNGLGTLIESVPYVAKEFPDVLFVLAGKGPSRQLIEDRINELGIKNNVLLTGFVPDELLPVYYNASDYFVLPSASGEGLPLVLFEAMACGLPVVATTVGGTPEIVEQKKNGVLVPARSPKLMANALLDLLKNEKLTKTIGETARTDIVNRFSWDENARKLEEVYKQFLS